MSLRRIIGWAPIVATCVNVAVYFFVARAAQLDRVTFWTSLIVAALAWLTPFYRFGGVGHLSRRSRFVGSNAVMAAAVLWIVYFGRTVGYGAVIEYGIGGMLLVCLLLLFVMVIVVVLHFASRGRFLPIRKNERPLK